MASPASARLPVEDALPALLAALREGPSAVLQAPPGAGKTTRVPLALLGEPWAGGRLLMLEPRRIAARSAAERMAETLGEPPGRTVGWRVRGETRVSAATRIEALTEGVLTRILQGDPSLGGVSAVIFDEAHERSIQGDLGLALALEAQGALRPDLRLLVMSATLDAGPFARLMGGAPVVTAEGRAWPVETRWLAPGRRAAGREALAGETAAAVLDALAEDEGDILVFLPGRAEIGRVAARLSGALPEGVELRRLTGDAPLAEQRRALAPSEGARRVVLSTSVAETSLTVPGVRVVIDAGLARRARHDPGSGMTRLVTERASRAEADQRRGRAGREAPGVCRRLWPQAEEGALPAFAPPEIVTADLAPLALELALWGARDAAGLAFLDPPPEGAFNEARTLLAELGALDAEGAVTEHGRAMARAPLHPRLAHMVLATPEVEAATARALAGLLAERDPLRGAEAACDLRLRLDAFASPGRFARERGVEPDRAALARTRKTADRLAADAARRGRVRDAPFADPSAGRETLSIEASAASSLRAPLPAAAEGGGRGEGGAGRRAAEGSPAAGRPSERIDREAAGRLLARAFPDRIALRRPGGAARFLLSGGKGARLPEDDPLAAEPFLVAADLDGDPREARIRLAAPLSRAEIDALFAGAIEERRVVEWSRRERDVVARFERRLGALALDARPLSDPDPEALVGALTEGVRALGLAALRWTPEAERLRRRVLWAREAGEDFPDWSEAGLLAGLEDWFAPRLYGLRRAAELGSVDAGAALRDALGREGLGRLTRVAPEAWETPDGVRHPLDYGGEGPRLSARPQALYGLDVHPAMAGRPILLDLLSPAGRLVATTADLPGFWRGAWVEVRKEMRGRYPKHDWPEAPWLARPSRRPGRRG